MLRGKEEEVKDRKGQERCYDSKKRRRGNNGKSSCEERGKKGTNIMFI